MKRINSSLIGVRVRVPITFVAARALCFDHRSNSGAGVKIQRRDIGMHIYKTDICCIQYTCMGKSGVASDATVAAVRETWRRTATYGATISRNGGTAWRGVAWRGAARRVSTLLIASQRTLNC